MAREDDRALGLLDQLGGLRQLVLVDAVGVGFVAAQRDLVLPVELAGVLEHVARDVDEDGPGTAGRRDIEGLLHRPRNLVDVANELIVLGDRDRDALDVCLLEAVTADQRTDHLAGDANQRNGIHEGVGDTGDEVRRARAGGSVADPRLAADACVGVGGVCGALLVLHQVVLDRVFFRLDAFGDGAYADAAVLQHVVERQIGAAGEAEDGVDAFSQEGFHHHLCARIQFVV